MGERFRIAVVGARRRRQGIGEHVARHFHAAGMDVCAIVGTSESTVAEARDNLLKRHGIDCRGYLSLESLLAHEHVDIVALCSPPEFHREQLTVAADAGVNVLCEKPLWWEEGEDVLRETQRLVDRFASRGLLLEQILQWPRCITSFRNLYPEETLAEVDTFSMLLSPVSSGWRMMLDAAPHGLSMLNELVGPGEIDDIIVQHPNDDPTWMQTSFNYKHGAGKTKVILEFKRCLESPRPAGFIINTKGIRREITLPSYNISFHSGDRRIAVQDPLRSKIDEFVSRLSRRERTNSDFLMRGMRLLETLVRNAVKAEDDLLANKTKNRTDGIHDFATKLLQPHTLDRLKNYVRWQARTRRQLNSDPPKEIEKDIDQAPVSINLDLTTACNYSCDHCVDIRILNTGIRHEDEQLKLSLENMAARGLKSVIIIGGGEPTVHPAFSDVVRQIKSLGLQVGIVTNGSGNSKIAQIANILEKRDWVRLSLDAGSDPTFQAIHKPRHPLSLEQICRGLIEIRKANRDLAIGFSFVVIWRTAKTGSADLTVNVHEMAAAARLAKDSGFTYIAFKPFLERAENNAERIGLNPTDHSKDTLRAISVGITEARAFQDESFSVVVSTNLKALLAGSCTAHQSQPRMCHMTFFRQVLSPLGVFNCPVYRGVPLARIGNKTSYAIADPTKMKDATLNNILEFNAKEECSQVTCLYNDTNWWIENLIEDPAKLDQLELAKEEDYFL